MNARRRAPAGRSVRWPERPRVAGSSEPPYTSGALPAHWCSGATLPMGAPPSSPPLPWLPDSAAHRPQHIHWPSSATPRRLQAPQQQAPRQQAPRRTCPPPPRPLAHHHRTTCSHCIMLTVSAHCAQGRRALVRVAVSAKINLRASHGNQGGPNLVKGVGALY